MIQTRVDKILSIHNALSHFFGNDFHIKNKWLCSHNYPLGSIPLDMIETEDGYDRVINYIHKNKETQV